MPETIPAADIMEVVRTLPDVLFRCYKGDDGKIYWSLNEGGLAEAFGLTTKDIQGKSLHDLFPGGASPELEEHFELAFQGVSTIFTNQIGDRHFRHFPKPIMGEDGKVKEVVGYIAEVTDLVQTQRELEMANRELDAFVHTASHDLKNPLTVLNTLLQFFGEHYRAGLDAPGRQYLDKMGHTVKTMQDMTNALLQLSRARQAPLEKRTVNLSALAHEIAQNLQMSDKARNVMFEIHPDLTAQADKALLGIVLQNLISNAWKYTAPGTARISFMATETSRGPAFVVRDDGPGFESKVAEAIFEPFRRSHGADFEGSGVGLSTVDRIIHRHGGEVWAESAPGEGAAFFFTLP